MTLRSLIRTIPDYPKPGIQFRDITTLCAIPRVFSSRSTESQIGTDGGIDVVVGIEARGFIFGTAVAYSLGCGFVPLRKPGKLPGDRSGGASISSTAAIGSRSTSEGSSPRQRVLLVDDLIATGGTAEAAIELLREVGAEVVECAFVVALPELGGVARLERLGSGSLALRVRGRVSRDAGRRKALSLDLARRDLRDFPGSSIRPCCPIVSSSAPSPISRRSRRRSEHAGARCAADRRDGGPGLALALAADPSDGRWARDPRWSRPGRRPSI